jgi:hypothetical protein
MAMSRDDDVVSILHAHEHYSGYVNGKFVVSGDTWKEVHDDLVEMGYLK